MHTPFRQLQRLPTFKEQGRQITLSLHAKVSAVILLLLVIPFTAFFLHPIIEMSTSLIRNMQQMNLLLYLQASFRMANQVCCLWTIAAWSCLLYHLLDPRPGVKVIGVTCFAFYLCSLLNMIYSEPRPYWVQQQGIEPECNRGFGMPSSDLFFAIVFSFYLTIQVLRRTNEHSLTILIYVLLSLCMCFIAVGEVFLGENFPHQVLITASYAFVFLILCLALDSNLTRWFYKAAFNYEKNKTFSVYMTIFSILLIFFAVVIKVVSHRQYLSTVWLENIAASVCPMSVGPAGAFEGTAVVLYNIGVLTGSMHAHKSLNEFWWNTPRYKGFIRFIIAVGSQILIYEGMGLLNVWIFSDKPDEATNYVFGLCVPLYCAGFFLTGVLPQFFEKCYLTETDDSQVCTI